MKLEVCRRICSVVEGKCVCERERKQENEIATVYPSSVTKYLHGIDMELTRPNDSLLPCSLSGPVCPYAGRHHYTSCTHQLSASRKCRAPLPRNQPFPLETCPLGTNTCTPSSSMSASHPSTGAWAAVGGLVCELESGVGVPHPAFLVSQGLSLGWSSLYLT